MAQTITSILVYTLAVLGYLFFYWKAFKEDYTSNIIFSSGFLILILFCVPLFLISIFSIPAIAFWAAVAGFLIGVLYVRRLYKFRLFELIEASGMAMLIFFFAYCIYSILKIANPVTMLLAILVPIVFLFYFYTNRNYKKFNWYKSGRVGFSGLASLGLFFLIRSVIVVVSPPAVLFLDSSIIYGRVDALISFFVSIILFFCLYRLSNAK